MNSETVSVRLRENRTALGALGVKSLALFGSGLNLMLTREAVLTTWLADTEIIPRPFVTNEAFAALQYAVHKARQLPWRMTILWRQGGHTGWALSVAYSPDGVHGGDRIVSGSDDQTVRVWDAKTGQELTRLTGHTGLEHQSTPIVEDESHATLY